MSPLIYKRFIWSGIIIITILVIGTLGYWFIGGGQYSVIDALYMTFITITTIGFGEIIDLSGNVLGRIFTIFIALSGIGILAYIVTNFTALIVEGDLKESFWRRRMEKKARDLKGHYIICGFGLIGAHIINELQVTKRLHVIIDINPKNVEGTLDSSDSSVLIEGDATDNDTLLRAGITNAKGLFAVTGDDNQNLVIVLTARQLNPALRIVARCNEIKNTTRIKKAGADSVVSPSYIGGLRMASEMVRPTVVSFLDTMLRDTKERLRVEEVSVPDQFIGKTISSLNLNRYHDILLLAIKTREDWIYNPPDNHVIQHGNTLVFMTTPRGMNEIESYFHNN
jgi:voltage-gated potassium channel